MSRIMLDTIKNLPQQFLDSLDTMDRVDWKGIFDRPVKRIFVAGMGGSTIAAELINDSYPGQAQLYIVRDYRLPRNVNSNDLVLCASYSGNTEETISCFKNALAKKARLIVLAHGGELQKLAQQNYVPYISIPDIVQPRQAVGNFFTCFLGVLEKAGFLPSQRESLVTLSNTLRNRMDSLEAQGAELAKKLKGCVPIIYGPSEFAGVCRIWKIKVNESVKTPAFYYVFPETNHNDMVGWTNFDFKPAFVYLMTQSMHPRVQKRMDVMEKMLKDRLPVHRCVVDGDDTLQEIFLAILLGDFTTLAMANDAGVDPSVVEMVESFKKMLG